MNGDVDDDYDDYDFNKLNICAFVFEFSLQFTQVYKTAKYNFFYIFGFLESRFSPVDQAVFARRIFRPYHSSAQRSIIQIVSSSQNPKPQAPCEIAFIAVVWYTSGRNWSQSSSSICRMWDLTMLQITTSKPELIFDLPYVGSNHASNHDIEARAHLRSAVCGI